MRWFELIFLLVIGVLFICCGWAIWKKEKITLIHEYHYKKVNDNDKKAYTEKMGQSLLITGIGIALTGIIDFVTKTFYGWCVFGVGLCIGLILMIYAQKKYNRGFF